MGLSLDAGFISLLYRHLENLPQGIVFLNVMAVSSTFGEYVVYPCWLTFILLLARLVIYSEHGLRWNDSVAFCVEVTRLLRVSIIVAITAAS